MAVSAVIPQKRPKGGHLNLAARQRNRKVGHDRVPVENGFGRGQSLFGVLHRKYTWCRERLNEIIDICLSLTNYHIRLHPLRAEDREYYHRVLSTMRAKADKMKTSGAERQRRYRHRRDQINRALTADATEEVEDVYGGRGGDLSRGTLNAIDEVVATSVARVNEDGGGNTSDISATDVDGDTVDESVNALLADELAGDGGEDTELELTDGGDGGNDGNDGDDSDGGLQVSALSDSDSDDSLMESITKRHPQMKMKRKRLSKVSHCRVISRSRS